MADKVDPNLWTTTYKCPNPTLDESPVTEVQPDLGPNQTAVTISTTDYAGDITANQGAIDKNTQNYKNYIEKYVPAALKTLRDKLDCVSRLLGTSAPDRVSYQELTKASDQLISSTTFTDVSGLYLAVNVAQTNEVVEFLVSMNVTLTGVAGTVMARILDGITPLAIHREYKYSLAATPDHHVVLAGKLTATYPGLHIFTVQAAKLNAGDSNFTVKATGSTRETYLQVTRFKA
jgi:hypothetical protein